MKILVIIPARGGSKGILYKNVISFAGKPLIAWTIESAIKSGCIDRVIISTDDEKIAEISRKFGAEVPFFRPPELSGDDIGTLPVLTHALKWLEENDNYIPDYMMLLQPTSPLRNTEDIKESVKIAKEKNADSVISVCETKAHPYILKTVSPDGKLTDFITKPSETLPRQKLSKVYVLNGAIYLVRNDVFREKETFYTDKTYALLMPQERSVDIDTELDLKIGEFIFQINKHAAKIF